MPGAAHHRTIPLPKGWPKRVRSAVIQVMSLAHLSLIATRNWAANNWNARLRPKYENERLRQELALLCEEVRMKDDRMARIPAQRRPHYTAPERLATLELRAARGWSQAQTAERLLVTPLTVASWMRRLDEGGPHAILRIHEPVNKFPDFVAYVVRRLKILCPSLGKARIAQVLCRAGLHLGSTTVRRMLRDAPRHLVTDRGEQFRSRGFRLWCHQRGIAQRFGAAGKHGSIAVIEPFIRTMKEECTRKLLVPYDRAALRREVSL